MTYVGGIQGPYRAWVSCVSEMLRGKWSISITETANPSHQQNMYLHLRNAHELGQFWGTVNLV